MRYETCAAWLVGIACTMGCAKEPSTALHEQGQFEFKPKDATIYNRTATWTREIALVGTSLRRTEGIVFTWTGVTGRDADNRPTRTEGLLSVDGTVNDRRVVHATPKSPVTIIYHFTSNGDVFAVEGLDSAASAVLDFYPPSMRTAGYRAAVEESLRETVAFVPKQAGEIVGRDARVGSTWKVEGAPGSVAVERTYVVKGLQSCPLGTCVVLEDTARLDPHLVSAAVQSAVDELLTDAQGRSALSLQGATFRAGGSMVVDPATMMNVNAKTSAEGDFTFATKPDRSLVVQVKIARNVEFAYP